MSTPQGPSPADVLAMAFLLALVGGALLLVASVLVAHWMAA
jgi:hypothetical protein